MSHPDEPDKKRPQPTVAWNPEDLPDFEEGSPAESGTTPGGESTGAGGAGDEPEEDPLVGTLLRDKWRVLKRLLRRYRRATIAAVVLLLVAWLALDVGSARQIWRAVEQKQIAEAAAIWQRRSFVMPIMGGRTRTVLNAAFREDIRAGKGLGHKLDRLGRWRAESGTGRASAVSWYSWAAESGRGACGR